MLDYERASHIIRTATHIGIAMCYCRHKMGHVGKACDAPMDICMTFNRPAASLIRHGIIRPVTVSECMASWRGLTSTTSSSSARTSSGR